MTSALLLCFVCLLGQTNDANSTGKVERIHRTYDIQFLTEAIRQYRSPLWPEIGTPSLLKYRHEYADDGFGGVSFESVGLEVTPGKGVSEKLITEIIRTNIAEDSWLNKSNFIRSTSKTLSVRQTVEVHKQIDAFLKRLRARRARMIFFEAILVPARVLNGMDSELTDEEYRSITKAVNQNQKSLILTIYNDQTLNTFQGKIQTQLYDHEVNSTGVIPTRNPSIRKIPLGLTIEIHPSVIPSTGKIHTRVKVASIQRAGETLKHSGIMGDLEFIPLEKQSIQTELVLSPDRMTIAGYFEDRSLGDKSKGLALLIKAKPFDTQKPIDPPPVDPDLFIQRAYDISFLLKRLSSEGDHNFETEILYSVTPEIWRDDRSDLDISTSGFIQAIAPKKTHEALLKWIQRKTELAGKKISGKVQAFETDLPTLLAIRSQAPNDIFSNDNWKTQYKDKLKLLYSGALSGLSRTHLKSGSYKTRGYISDYETVSGGTGFSIIPLTDPVIREAGNGVTFDLFVHQTLNSTSALVNLKLAFYKTDFSKSLKILTPYNLEKTDTPGARTSNTDSSTIYNSMRLTWLPSIVELPKQTLNSCEIRRRVQFGKESLLQIQQGQGTKWLLYTGTITVETGGEK